MTEKRPTDQQPAKLRLAIVGAGPAGIYAADILLKAERNFEVSIDLFDHLPAPYGLVRYGVAPDHPRIKGIISALRDVLDRGDIRIFGNVGPGFSQAQAIDGALATARESLPDGYRALPAGSSQAFAESFDSLGFAFFMGIVVAYMVLAAQFNSFTHPVVVLLALPFSISGALLMLYLMGQSLNVYSVLGLILLMGIAKKNSIMLVDFTNQIRARGLERHEALLQACPVRLRPILMTSIATIAGATPAAFAFGAGGETQRPMAIGLVGGMLVSTVMTLFVVPAAYSVFDDVVTWNEERQRNGVGLLAGIRSPRSARVAAADR